MVSRQGLKILEHIRVIENIPQRDALIDALASPAKTTVVSFVNAHAFNMAWDDPAFAADLCRSDLLLRDGVGVSLLMRLVGMGSGVNMNGTDFIPLILRAFSGRRVALCGTAEPYLGAAAEAVKKLGCDVVLTMNGFLDAGKYAPLLADARPEVIILGMGMPKQESIALLLAATLRVPVVIINGGAILDFLANRFPRAPQIYRQLRLEWLFRLIQEPRRLWRRYVLGGGVFVLRAALLKMIIRYNNGR